MWRGGEQEGGVHGSGCRTDLLLRALAGQALVPVSPGCQTPRQHLPEEARGAAAPAQGRRGSSWEDLVAGQANSVHVPSSIPTAGLGPGSMGLTALGFEFRARTS
jgi:hypothetical protein